MAWMAPIIASQTQEENDYDGDSSSRPRNFLIISSITSVLFFLGIFFFIGRSSTFSFPMIYIVIIMISMIWGLSSASRTRSRRRTQNYSQSREPNLSIPRPTTIKRDRNYCLQCGSKIDRDIDNLSIYYCSHCGYEIKNTRV